MTREGIRARAVRPGWDIVIDPDDEYRHRVFNVNDEQLHAFLHALVMNGVQDFRVVRQPDGFGHDPFELEPADEPWPDVGDVYIPV